MEIAFECTYCGKKWSERFYNQYSAQNQRCSVCNDKNLKYKSVEESKINYYEGSPPFPVKEDTVKEDEDLDNFKWLG